MYPSRAPPIPCGCIYRSVHFGVEPVPNLCVELRGYNAGEGPDENCAFPNGGVNTPSTTGCSSWWDPREAPPKFQQMQRTDDPGGSFAFVTPESGMVLIFAAYAHGGDYPTTVRFLQHRADDGSTGAAAQQHRRHVTPGVESGRLEVRINLSERTGVAELLSWSASARENDHSPCALGKAVGVNDGSAIWGGTRVVQLSTSTSSLQYVPGWVDHHDLTGGDALAGSGLDHLSITREGAGNRETPTGQQQLAALLRSSCLNYGQQGAGLWEANPAVCAIFHSALETEQVRESLVQTLAELMEKVRYDMGIRGIAEAAIAFGGMLFLLCKLLSCFFGVSSASEDGYGHIAEDGYGHVTSTGGNSEHMSDTMVGAFDRSMGGMSQLAITEPRHLAESNVRTTENGRSDDWGRPKRVVANTAEGTHDLDAFSSMFSALDNEMSPSVAPKEGSSVGLPQRLIRDKYVVFEQ